MLEFRTLGSIELHGLDGRTSGSVLLHPKRLALLTYLCASSPPRWHRRDTLVGLLWPEQDEAHARGALRQELYQLRRALGPGALLGDRADAVGVDPERVWCDVVAFEAALDSGRPCEALDLFRGEFLPGLQVEGGGFERWVDRKRDRLCRRAMDAARRLGTEAERAGDEAGATTWARRLTELAPYDETAWQRLMALLDRQGDRAGALKAYDSLSAWLRDEVGVDPSPETRTLVERIRGRSQVFAGSATDLSAAGRAEVEGRAPPLTRAVIGIRPVENQTGDPALDTLARRITDRLAQGLAGAMFADVAPGWADGQVTAVVSASMYARGELVEVVPRLAEPGQGGRLVEMPRAVQLHAQAPDQHLDALVAHVLVSVAAHYDPRFDAAATRERALPIRTPLWEAYLEYLQGSELFGLARYDEGYRHLLAAYRIDPDFVKAGVFAAIALAASGQPAEADALATSVMDAPRPLCAYEQCLGGWFLADLRGRRAEAYRVASEATRVTGHPIMWGIAAREALRMNRPHEALRVLDGVEWGEGWWRHMSERWEMACGAHHLLRSHQAELREALAARARFPGRLDTIGLEARARAALGQSDLVSGLVEEALTLPGGLSSPADVAWIAAQELDAHEEAEAARNVREIALEWLDRREGASLAERQLRVRLLLEMGEVPEAGRGLGAIAPCQDLEALSLAGLVAARRGDAGAARAVIVILEGIENPYLSGRHLLAVAGIQAALGPAEVAMATLRRALAAGLPFGVDLHALPALAPLAGRADFRALLRPRD